MTASLHRLEVALNPSAIAIAGASGAVTADLPSAQDLQLPRLAPASQQKRRDSVPGIAMVCNPVDMTGQSFSRSRLATEVLQTLLAGGVAEILLVYATGSLHGRIAPELIGIAAGADCLVVMIATYGTPETRHRLEAAEGEGTPVSAPLALKIPSPDIAHKTEVGGVRLNLQAEAVGPAARAMLTAVSAAVPQAELRGLQPMEQGVCEMIIGVTRAPVFGLALTVGLGGVMTGLLPDTAHRLLPVDAGMAREMLQELRMYRLMQGFRGKSAADVQAAAQAIACVSSAAMALGPARTELEINPLLARPQGQGAIALDALLRSTADETAP